MISPEPEQPTDIYRLIREAIERKQQVLATYHGYYREMCPQRSATTSEAMRKPSSISSEARAAARWVRQDHLRIGAAFASTS